MRTNTGAIARVVAFTVVSLAFVFILVAVFGQFRFDTRTSYRAVFSNVSGLKGGNFVRIAGVEVGKVSDLKLEKDGTVHINFAIDKGLMLTEGTKASVRYENLIGDRYLALEHGPGSPRRLQPGATIPLARTSPALDVDALIGGFRPLFRALDPDQVNALSGQLLRVFQGEGATISSVLGETSALTTTLANRDKLIGDVITNLNTVRHTFGTRDKQFSDGLDKLPLLVGALSDHNYFADLVRTLPDVYQTLSRQGLYGDYFGFYICDVIIKLSGRNGQPTFVKLVSQVTGRCLPKK